MSRGDKPIRTKERPNDPHHFERVRRRQYPRRQARTATASTLRSSRTTCRDFYQWFYFRAGRRGGPRGHACGSPIAPSAAYPNGWPDYKARDGARPRGMGADRRHQLRRRRPDDDADPAAGRRCGSLISRLIRWSGTTTSSPRSRRLPGVALPLARQEPRRAGHRLPDDRRGPAQRLALRPPAPRRDAWPNGGWKARSRN